MKFGNIECRTDNAGAIALARSFGLMRYPEGDFSMPTSGTTEEIAFYGFRMNINELRRSAHQTLEKKNMLESLGLIQRNAQHCKPKRKLSDCGQRSINDDAFEKVDSALSIVDSALSILVMSTFR